MKYLLPLIICLSLFVSACSNEKNKNVEAEEDQTEAVDEAEETKQEDNNKLETDNQEDDNSIEAWWQAEPEYYELEDFDGELSETEQQLMRKPGLLSGDAYDLEEAKKKLDEVPLNASEDELKNAILTLIHEDYHEETEVFVRMNPSVNVEVDTPDETIEEPTLAQSHFAILLDASGSMNAASSGGTRMDDAKAAIQDFMDNLPENSSVSLMVYGHKGTGADQDKALSCGSTEIIYEGAADSVAVTAALKPITPAGWTPIGKALSETKNNIPEGATSMIVYVVSDGIETCDGNPVEEAKKLAAEGIQPIINIIGFQVDNEAQALLKQVAEAGNGEFSLVSSKQELDKYWREEYNRMMDAWKEWRNEGMEKAKELRNELIDTARKNRESILDKTAIEFKRAKELIDYLEEKEYENTRNLWSYFYSRKNSIWNYGYSTGNSLRSKAYNSGNEAWLHFYHTGNDKWIEYYHKR